MPASSAFRWSSIPRRRSRRIETRATIRAVSSVWGRACEPVEFGDECLAGADCDERSCSPGRLRLAALRPRSTWMFSGSTLRAASPSRCAARSWPLVETPAYPIFIPVTESVLQSGSHHRGIQPGGLYVHRDLRAPAPPIRAIRCALIDRLTGAMRPRVASVRTMSPTGPPSTRSRSLSHLSKRARANMVWVLLLTVLVAAIWVISLALTPAPLSLSQASKSVDALADELIATLPTGTVVGSSDDSALIACPLKDGRRQYVLNRRLRVNPDFDRAAWMADRDAEYGARDGWDSRVRILGDQSDRQLKLVGKDLGIMTITGTSVNGGRLTFRATSACAS